jgi:hypothetical protein
VHRSELAPEGSSAGLLTTIGLMRATGPHESRRQISDFVLMRAPSYLSGIVATVCLSKRARKQPQVGHIAQEHAAEAPVYRRSDAQNRPETASFGNRLHKQRNALTLIRPRRETSPDKSGSS